MLFASGQLPALIDGSITRTYRAWKRPQARVGGRYRLNREGVLEVEALSVVKIADITERDAHRAGFANKETLVAKLNQRATVSDRSKVYRVDFSYLALADERDALSTDAALSNEDTETLSARLRTMDRLSQHGPWTSATLAIIKRHPRVVASHLAEKLCRDRNSFKADVRKLKKLGLTVSHEVGYEISPGVVLTWRALARVLADLETTGFS